MHVLKVVRVTSLPFGMCRVEIPGVSQVERGQHRHQASLFTRSLLFLDMLYDRMGFDDVGSILKLLRGNKCDYDCMYLLVNTAHTHSHEDTASCHTDQGLKRWCC